MKRKGFTLIELLAVIVILAVIALIATPLVMNIIEESRKSSFRVSVENMIRAMENDQAIQGYISLSYEFPLTSDTTLGLKGDIDNWQGKSSIDEDGNTAVSIYNGTYCAYKKKDDNSVSVEKVSSEEECLDFTQANSPVMMEGELASMDLDFTNSDDAESILMSMFASKFLNGPIMRQEIESIRISDTKEVPGTVIGSFDVSENQDESVIAYYSDNDGNGLYEIVIGGEGGVSASANVRFLFFAPFATTIDLSKFDTSQVTDMSFMFYGCTSLTELDVSNFNTFNVTDMMSMFGACTSLTELYVSNFDTSKVTDMSSMFTNCESLTKLNLSNFNTSKVTNMAHMFDSCSSLTELDLSNFDTSKVTNMVSMFERCSQLISLDLSNFDTAKVTDMERMFRQCNDLISLDLRNMVFDQVILYSQMFGSILTQNNIAIIVKDSSAKTFIEARLSDANETGTVTIAS